MYFLMFAFWTGNKPALANLDVTQALSVNLQFIYEG